MGYRILLLVFFGCFSLNLSAQTNSDFDYNIGVNAVSFLQMNQVINNQSQKAEIRKILPGLLFKINNNQFAYRIGLQYHRNNNLQFNDADTATGRGAYAEYAFTLGFEHDLSTARLKTYYGADLGFIHNEFSGREYRNLSMNNNRLRSEKNGFIVAPFMGLKYTLASRIYLSLETGLSFIYGYNRIQKSLGFQNSVTVTRFTKGEFSLSPLSLLGLHYNLGKSN